LRLLAFLLASASGNYNGKLCRRSGGFFLKLAHLYSAVGLAIVPFLHGGVVKEFWLAERASVLERLPWR